ncbi:hypothetical protein DO97_17055 [Neosynechococcus sphagnicola sy1]|uniref:AIG1-type G domain-containing protein n=1 Tax=Neosynechococcus sphagnicola sy1 TaxID=1497020 RepID=A0A098TI40_9CYAN|nr:GTPase [Neosynechococcus sphagnicola]KGF71642.1 hypothetical protein DO97_17055 [Neosynechococcus sphagnicola sy1]
MMQETTEPAIAPVPPEPVRLSKARKLLMELTQKLQQSKDKKFVLMLVGRTGVGKSSTINSLLGQEVATVGDFEPSTMRVSYYECELHGIKFDLVDTPGLCDDLEEVGNDQEYLAMIKNRVSHIDSMLFVSRLDETRVTGDEKRGIQLISLAFTPKVWEHAVIVFTHSNAIPADRFLEVVEKRTDLVEREIAHYAGMSIAGTIPSVAIDNLSKTTPNGEEWLGELYTKVFVRISQGGTLPFLLATAQDLVPPQAYPPGIEHTQAGQPIPMGSPLSPPFILGQTGGTLPTPIDSSAPQEPRIKLNQEQKQEIKKKIDSYIISGLSTVGVGIGASFYGPLGASIGGAIGAVIGLILWLWS